VNFLQTFTSGNSLHCAQNAMFFSIQQVRILHQEAFVFCSQPGHFDFLNLVQAPQ